eukprot:gene11077-12072_t
MQKDRWFYTISQQNTLLPSLFRLSYIFFESLKHEICSVLPNPFRRKREVPPFRLTLKRLFILYVLVIILPLLVIWNHLGFFLDDYFYPDWRKTKIVKPWFVIGNARSGTTWFHRLLVKSDLETFTSFHTWEILFAVSITWKRLFSLIYDLDHVILRGLLTRLLRLVEHRLFGYIKIHEISLFAVEEDEWLMLHIGLCQLILFFFPEATSLLQPLIHFDYHPDMLTHFLQHSTQPQDNPYSESQQRKEMLSLTSRFAIFDFYRQCVQRHLYFRHLRCPRSTSLVFVSKNPAFTLRLTSLTATFPDCRVLCLVREPTSSIPSMISYISHVWKAFSSPTSDYPNALTLLSFCESHYLFPLWMTPVLFNSRQRAVIRFISYEQTKRNVVKEVMPLLRSLLSSEEVAVRWRAVKEYLTHETFHSSAFISEHKYDVARCCGGLTIDELKEKMSLVYKLHADVLPLS